MQVVHQILTAEGDRDRQAVPFREGGEVVAGRLRPSAAARQHQRLLGYGQHFAKPVHVRRAGICLSGVIRLTVFGVGPFRLHVFGKG